MTTLCNPITHIAHRHACLRSPMPPPPTPTGETHIHTCSSSRVAFIALCPRTHLIHSASIVPLEKHIQVTTHSTAVHRRPTEQNDTHQTNKHRFVCAAKWHASCLIHISNALERTLQARNYRTSDVSGCLCRHEQFRTSNILLLSALLVCILCLLLCCSSWMSRFTHRSIRLGVRRHLSPTTNLLLRQHLQYFTNVLFVKVLVSVPPPLIARSSIAAASSTASSTVAPHTKRSRVSDTSRCAPSSPNLCTEHNTNAVNLTNLVSPRA